MRQLWVFAALGALAGCGGSAEVRAGELPKTDCRQRWQWEHQKVTVIGGPDRIDSTQVPYWACPDSAVHP